MASLLALETWIEPDIYFLKNNNKRKKTVLDSGYFPSSCCTEVELFSFLTTNKPDNGLFDYVHGAAALSSLLFLC